MEIEVMSDYHEASKGSLDLRGLTGAEFLARVCSMFDDAPDPDGAYLDVSFTDATGFPRIMRMFLPEIDRDSSTIN
jgi:hypothetical protein